MAHKPKNAKEKLEQLAEHLRLGWKKQYPVKEEDLSKVREAMREQWQDEQKEKLKEEQSKDESQSHDRDHGHEH